MVILWCIWSDVACLYVTKNRIMFFEDIVFEYQDLRQLEQEEYNLLESTEEYSRTGKN